VTLQIFSNIEQGYPQWLEARCGLLTASTIGKLLTPTGKVADNDTSRSLTETLVAERITRHVDYVQPSFDMQLGTLNEPLARQLYAEQYAPVTEIGFAIREIDGHKIGASPDGLIGDEGGLEIKSRRPKAQIRAIVTDTVPTENLAQIHTCMFVLDRQWWDYCSYSQGLPLYVHRVYRDKTWDALISAALAIFEANAARMIDTYMQAAGDNPVAPRVDHFAEIEIA
jgi:hypothetical protein